MSHTKDLFSQKQFLTKLKLCFPTALLRKAVAASGGSTRERDWPRWLLIWTLIAGFFRAGDGLHMIAGWLKLATSRNKTPSEEALYQARKRLGWKPLRWIRRHLVTVLADLPQDPTAFFRGRRLLAFDGTTFTVADTPANDASFGRANNQYKKSGFPLLRVVALCELGTHAVIHWIARKYACSEQHLAQRLLRFVPAGSLLLGDRNFHDFKLWQAAKAGSFDLLLRVKSTVKLPVLQRLPDGSYLSEIHARTKRKSTPPIPVRVIVYQIPKNGTWEECRVITSLLSVSDGTAQELAELYARRWEHELVFGEIKASLAGRVTDLRAKSPLVVLQELDALVLGHYVVRALILDAARSAGVSPIEISFKYALRVIADALLKLPKSAGGYQEWYQKLIAELVALPRRERRQRSYPRVRKVVRCAWPVKKPHHQQDKTAKKPMILSP